MRMCRTPAVAVPVIAHWRSGSAPTRRCSASHAVLLRPLPYAPDRLVALYSQMDGNPGLGLSDQYWITRTQPHAAVAAVATTAVNLTGDAADAERLLAAGVTTTSSMSSACPPRSAARSELTRQCKAHRTWWC